MRLPQEARHKACRRKLVHACRRKLVTKPSLQHRFSTFSLSFRFRCLCITSVCLRSPRDWRHNSLQELQQTSSSNLPMVVLLFPSWHQFQTGRDCLLFSASPWRLVCVGGLLTSEILRQRCGSFLLTHFCFLTFHEQVKW